MKISVLKGLLNGDRGRECLRNTPEMKEKLKCFCEVENKLKDGLTSEQLKIYKTFEDARIDYSSVETEFFFTEGFKLGLLSGIESVED